MRGFRLALDLCRAVSEQLDDIGSYTSETGMDCLAYTKQETDSMRLVAKETVKLGARVFQDMAGNITAVKESGSTRSAVMMGGSHLDAVPQGGQYDGRAGVLAELAILKMLHAHEMTLQFDYALQIFRAEESPRFGKALIGSGFATGRMALKDFARQAFGTGETLLHAIKGQDLPSEALRMKVENGSGLLPLHHIGAFRETHIEQANVLRKNAKDIGVVTGIRGNVRADVCYLGAAGHTGGEEQFVIKEDGYIDVRREATRGIIELAFRFEERCKDIAEQGRDIVFSVPQIKTPGSSLTKICDDCEARLEVRSTEPDVLEEINTFIQETVLHIAEKRRLILDQTKFSVVMAPAVPNLSEAMIGSMGRSAAKIGINALELPSGAGHDAMNMALAGVLTGMYFIPHNGLSHRPDENMVIKEGDDPFGLKSPFSDAVRALYETTKICKMPLKPVNTRFKSFTEAMIGNGAIELTSELQV